MNFILSETLIREFLASHSIYKNTYQQFVVDSKKNLEKSPTSSIDEKIVKRSHLAKKLGIYNLYNQNKASDNPKKSIIELVVNKLMSNTDKEDKCEKVSNSSLFNSERLESKSDVEKKEWSSSVSSLKKNSTNSLDTITSKKKKNSTDSFIEGKNMADVNNQALFTNSRESIYNDLKKVNINPGEKHMFSEEIEEIEDFEDTDFDFKPVQKNLNSKSKWETYQIRPELALELRKVIFDHSSVGEKILLSFNEEWKFKGFEFSENPELRYGIVQLKGGPCGLLAAVQAHVLKHLIFNSSVSYNNFNRGFLRPKQIDTERALIESLTEIIWRCSIDTGYCLVAIYNNISKNSKNSFLNAPGYKLDGFTEKMEITKILERSKLKQFLTENILTFTKNEKDNFGLIQLLYSAVLTRSIKNITKKDFDDSFLEKQKEKNISSNFKNFSSSFIGNHGYCTQEMINLLILGRATGNVFDGTINLNGENDKETKILRGVDGISEYGYLTLYEHYKSIQVGTVLKNPKYPIYLVCSESHFTVIFSSNTALSSSTKGDMPKRFDLFYYDGLANQDQEIRLTIDTSHKHLQVEKDEFTPPLEHCIRTKWPNAVIEWNGTDPLL
ncbi:hypothetical protein HK099_007974 [Clydaea vesicula]|uniref:Probable ubiquitin carboxyl-terminal hydrolase MINDY-4 n=1 Tax=Clydaea vesicula TaxID=447962 RepID=A0AAD5XTB7_9FUNG|nr:hypothetical protein HK099_007974 [Clydaea vesicula]KAJ3393492.1 hypothetical protein HDU92_007688 [Lobulomyces angularis]